MARSTPSFPVEQELVRMAATGVVHCLGPAPMKEAALLLRKVVDQINWGNST